jgi:hypothetical protein
MIIAHDGIFARCVQAIRSPEIPSLIVEYCDNRRTERSALLTSLPYVLLTREIYCRRRWQWYRQQMLEVTLVAQ